MVLERKGPVSTATRNCQNHVQRLRSTSLATVLPGSQGQDPRTLRPERLKWLSIPFPAKSHRRKASERGRGCWMGSTDPAKNELKAKDVAFQKWSHCLRTSPNSPWPGLTRPSSLVHRLKAGDGEKWEVANGAATRRAFAHHTYHLPSRRPQGPKPGRDYPSTFFRHGA